MDGGRHEPWIERVIRDSIEAGDFDGLSGSGRPIADLADTYDPAWWAKRFVARERRRNQLLDLAAELHRELPRILAHPDETTARHRLEDLAARIRSANTHVSAGDRLPELDVEATLALRPE